MLALAVTAAPAASGSSAAAPAAKAAAGKRAFTVHRSRYWSWTGPGNWTASYGAYGITVQGPKSGFDLGFASIYCVPAPTFQKSAEKYFASRRSELARDVRILGKTKVKRVPRAGDDYFRQTVDIKNTIGGTVYFGQVVFDYAVNDPTYCYQRSISFGAQARGYDASMRTLLKVYGSLAYFGPGAYEDTE